jgi:hypothetical protein
MDQGFQSRQSFMELTELSINVVIQSLNLLMQLRAPIVG